MDYNKGGFNPPQYLKMRITSFKVFEKEKNLFVIYASVTNSEENLVRVLIYNKEILEWSCSCMWGSIGRWQKKYIYQSKKCKHMKFLIKLIKDLEYL